MTNRWLSFLGLSWLIVILALGFYGAKTISQEGAVQFNLLALLPEGQTEKMQLSHKFMDDANVSGRVVVLLGHESPSQAKLALQKFREKLKPLGLPLIENNVQQVEADSKNLFTQLYAHRAGLLSSEDRVLLEKGSTEPLFKRAIANIMSPFGTFTSEQMTRDPFGFYPQYVSGLHKMSSFRTDADGDIFLSADNKTYYVYQGQMMDKIFSLQLQEKISESLIPVFVQLHADTGVQVLRLGGAFYAAAGAEQARGEISQIGLISTLGILLMLLILFKGPRSIFLAVTVVSSGLVAGLAACLYIFGSIHILAIVFGCSLVGVAVDYTLHFYCASYKQENGQSIQRRRILLTLLPALPLGVLTSSIGYGLLIVAPFPGIQQMAVLACVGLLTTFVSVSLWGHYFIFPGQRSLPVLAIQIQGVLEKLAILGARKNIKTVMALFVFAVFSYGAFHMNFDDNVRNFQSLDPQLKREEHQIKSMMSFDNSSQFIAVRAGDMESLLQQIEDVTQKLDGKGIIYRALSDLLPSEKRFKENAALKLSFSEKYFEDLVKAMDSDAVWSPKSLGFDEAEFKPESFLQKLPSGWSELVYREDQAYVGRILMTSPLDVDQSEFLNTWVNSTHSGVFVDPVDEYRSLFAAYRQVMLLLAVGLLAGFTLMIALRQGLFAATTITLPVLLSMCGTVGFLSFFGSGFSMFHAMGLILVLCIGIDYALFLYWRAAPKPGSRDLLLLGNGLAAVTTILSFGLLSLSHTTAVHSFGLTVFIGILLNFFITTLFLGSVPCKK